MPTSLAKLVEGVNWDTVAPEMGGSVLVPHFDSARVYQAVRDIVDIDVIVDHVSVSGEFIEVGHRVDSLDSWACNLDPLIIGGAPADETTLGILSVAIFLIIDSKTDPCLNCHLLSEGRDIVPDLKHGGSVPLPIAIEAVHQITLLQSQPPIEIVSKGTSWSEQDLISGEQSWLMFGKVLELDVELPSLSHRAGYVLVIERVGIEIVRLGCGCMDLSGHPMRDGVLL